MKYLAADFGSTYTKLTAIDSVEEKAVATANAFTTIETDIMHGFNNALEQLNKKTGGFNYDKLICCSSAGGGLKMVALGLVPELTAQAAKTAATSAGAKVVKTFAYEISGDEQKEIYNINPDLVLLCGGTDGGNKETILANAKLLCEINRNFSIIAAGNKSASRELEQILSQSGKDYVITKNVMPSLGKLEIEPAKECIRELFVKKIIDAKGLAGIQSLTDYEIIPTPLAVLNACELLSNGTKTTKGLGDLFALDIGGATTDVYSMSQGKPSLDNVLYKGLPEPYAKRTVEGDLGMRYSIKFLFEETDKDELAALSGATPESISLWVDKCAIKPDIIAPFDTVERTIDETLAAKAVEIASLRHCGVMEKFFTPMGEVYTLNGKDLSDTPYVIGIGGVIVNSQNPAKILAGAKYNVKNFNHMLPKNPGYIIDAQYIFSAMGLLKQTDPDLALKILLNNIKRV